MLLLSARSAEPPQNSGNVFASAWIVSPEAFLVAISFPIAKLGALLPNLRAILLVAAVVIGLRVLDYFSARDQNLSAIALLEQRREF